jgi:hypothetical protein
MQPVILYIFYTGISHFYCVLPRVIPSFQSIPTILSKPFRRLLLTIPAKAEIQEGGGDYYTTK